MKRPLLRSSAFVRASKRLVKSRSGAAQRLRSALVLLGEDAFNPQLRTHKLTGDLTGSWACSIAYDLRIVFQIVQHEGKEAILLQSVGTHDEVY